jgi:hypothetical protein
MKLLIRVFQLRINSLLLFGLENLEHHPMNRAALFQELDPDLKSSSRRIILLNLLRKVRFPIQEHHRTP